MAEKKWRIKSPTGGDFRIVAYDGSSVNPGVIIYDMQDGDEVQVMTISILDVDRLNALIADLQAARAFAFGAQSVTTETGEDSVRTTIELVASLKEQTQSRSEFARCEKVLKILRGG